MRRQDDRRIGRLLASVLAVALLVVVVPAGLVAVSRARFGSANPLAGLAGTSTDGLTRPIADQTVVDAVVRLSLCVIWIAVAVIVVTTVIEVGHLVRHRGLAMPAIRGLGWAQPIAHFIAVGLVAVLPLTGSRPSLAEIAVGAPPTTPDAPEGYSLDRTTDEVPSTRPAAPGAGAHVVRPGESVYAIAEDLAAGDPARVIEIADAILDANLGATMATGQRFTNPAYIEVGWVLEIPAGISTSATETPMPVPAEPEVTDTYEVRPGDTLWDIAREQLRDPEAWPEIWERNAGSDMGGGRTFDDPNLILPGWRLRLADRPVDRDHADAGTAAPAEPNPVAPTDPVETAEPEEVRAVPETPAEPAGERTDPTIPMSTATSPIPSTASTDRHGLPPPINAATASSTSTPLVPAGPPANGDNGAFGPPNPPSTSLSPLRLEHAALLAAGILGIVALRRRQRLRASLPHHRVPDPRPEVVETERRLRSIDAGERALRVDVACRAAAADLIRSGAAIGWVEDAIDGEVVIRSTAAASLPLPWVGAGQEWRLPADVPVELLSDAACRVDMPCVALVQLGVTADGGELLVDLEACGTLGVEAPPEVADQVVAAIGASLAASMWAEVAHLVLASLDPDAVLGHRNAHRCESTATAIDLATELVGSTVDDERTTFDLRSRRTGGEMWEPAIVLLTSEDDPVDVTAARPPGHGVAIVTSASQETLLDGARLVEHPTGWRFEGFGATVALTPLGLSEEDLGRISEVLTDASRPLEYVELPAAADIGWKHRRHDSEVEQPPVTTTDTAFEPMVHSIVIGLIGPVEVTDAAGNRARFERSKTVELLAWLATHRQRATRTGARTALWELDVRDATFANVVSEARRGLARLVPPPDGEEWVARTLTDQLPLHSAVVTDADLISERLDHARLQPPAQAIETLRPAVALIRGLPFEGTSYLWPDAEGITSNLVLLAIGAATEFAGHALSLGDTAGVFWSTEQGLRVLPGHEELIGLRMRAHAQTGDLAGVRLEWEAYERVLVADTWSDGEPAPKLLALRRELLGGEHRNVR